MPPKVEAWECPHTKKLFSLEDEHLYRAHLRRESRQRAMKRKADMEEDTFNKWLEESRANVRTLGDIEEFAINGFRRMFYRCGRTWADDKLKKDFRIVAVNFGKMVYKDSCSNSHSSPRSGENNWGGLKKGVPRGYPGWVGNVEFISTGDSPGFSMSTTMSKLGICTGSGGGSRGGQVPKGCVKQGYRVTIWLDDWPGIKARVEYDRLHHTEINVIEKLSGKRITEFTPTL